MNIRAGADRLIVPQVVILLSQREASHCTLGNMFLNVGGDIASCWVWFYRKQFHGPLVVTPWPKDS